MKKKTNPTTDAVEILHHRYVKDDPEMADLIEEERINAEIARLIHDARTQKKLTQRQLAAMVGTSHSAICRMEDADYGSHTLRMLKRIARALDHHLVVELVPDVKTGTIERRVI